MMMTRFTSRTLLLVTIFSFIFSRKYESCALPQPFLLGLCLFHANPTSRWTVRKRGKTKPQSPAQLIISMAFTVVLFFYFLAKAAICIHHSHSRIELLLISALKGQHDLRQMMKCIHWAKYMLEEGATRYKARLAHSKRSIGVPIRICQQR